MNVLITAGNTSIFLDLVRVITNIFKGRTGAFIARLFYKRGAKVTILTSNVSLTNRILGIRTKWYREPGMSDWEARFSKALHWVLNLGCSNKDITVISYTTFNDLFTNMRELITNNHYDVVIHSAAVSDYDVAGIYQHENGEFIPVDTAKKMSSSYKELYLKMIPTEKIIDYIRGWGFTGVLVKFKLQVGITDLELLDIANKSMHDSNADYIVANCLEWHWKYAYIISAKDDSITKVDRLDLPKELYDRIVV